jgi:hypothetical protein
MRALLAAHFFVLVGGKMASMTSAGTAAPFKTEVAA